MPAPFTFTLCADDYAMTPGVSRGILEALDAGALTATSVMTTSPWWPDSAAALKPHVGRADIGLHLNLTCGAPLGPMPVLAPEGRLPPITTLMRLSRQRALPLPEIAAEIDRQVDRFAEIFGRPPDHVDGHQHIQVLRPIRPLILGALEKRGWRPWLRDSADRPPCILGRGTCVRKAMGLAFLARGFSGGARQRGFVTNEGFAGFSTFDTTEDYGALFARYMRYPGAAHLVMCHPGYVDEPLRQLDPVLETREIELKFLTSPRFTELLKSKYATLERIGRIDAW